MIKNIVFTFLLLWANSLPAQVSVSFMPSYEKTPLLLEKTYPNPSLDQTIAIETFQFYISKVEFFNANEMVYAEESSYHLLDAADTSSLQLHFDIPEDLAISHIRFNIGIDSLTNVSGAFGGDLDPTNGMYWAWQNGYINFKLEGTASNCPARKNRFQFHIGGYMAPFNTLQTLELEVIDHQYIRIRVDLDSFLNSINLQETYQVMSPNQEAISLAQSLPFIFLILP